jgi:hypothetical protein
MYTLIPPALRKVLNNVLGTCRENRYNYASAFAFKTLTPLSKVLFDWKEFSIGE